VKDDALVRVERLAFFSAYFFGPVYQQGLKLHHCQRGSEYILLSVLFLLFSFDWLFAFIFICFNSSQEFSVFVTVLSDRCQKIELS
jgi:cellulose synthase/poly-beta-1,6-N-acetylglucosamine synthase-like glycosyltransferase